MDRAQFTTLIRGEQESLRRYLLALCCGDSDEANDIAQETLVKAYLSSSGYQEQGKFVAWVYRIAHNTFLDRQKSRRTLQPLEACRQMTDGNWAADRRFEYQDLYVALDALPAQERSAILLFYIKGYSIKEIAKVVSCSEDAVKKQLQRGREKLRHLVKR